VAEDNWAIEIQTNGTVLLQQEELKIVDKRIKIRPGRNYQPGKDNRPILRFDLSSQLSMGSLSRTAEMIHIDHGALELYDVDVEMVVGVASISDWSMVTLVNGSRLTGQGLSLTVLNPSLNHVALISLPEMESSELGELMPDSMTSRRNVVELKESICRGQFDFVIQSVNQASSFTLQNSAVATSGCLFRIDGSNAYESADDAARTVSIMLDHVTAVSTNGLLIASSGEHGSLPPLELGIDDSVFRVDTLGQALVEISGHEDYELLRENLKVTDRRDPSFFQVTGPLCVIDSTTMLLPGLGRELTPEQFGTSSQFVTKENLVMLPLDFNPARFHTVQPSDLDLRPGDGNPAIGASGDLQNAGVNWQSPRLPLVLPMQDDDAVSSN
jgi:hypothetical protein